MRERVADGSGPFEAQREDQERDRRYHAGPDHEPDHVARAGALDDQVAGAPRRRGEHDERQSADADGAPVGLKGDQPDAGEGQRHPGDLEPARPLAEHRGGEEQREERLGLQHQRGEARRDADVHADEQQRELDHADDERDRRDPAPGHRAAGRDHEHGERRERVPQGGEQQRRHVLEADLDDHEVEAPERGDEDGEGDVARGHVKALWCLGEPSSRSDRLTSA